jgi:hypothetical protein
MSKSTVWENSLWLQGQQKTNKIINKAVEMDKALLRVSHESKRA